jgi:ubiquilin
MEMMRNPQARQQMQRSQELAMSQLENHPGGFQHLRRMYNEVQEPMERAMSGGNDSSASSSSTPVSTTGALPNPGSSPSQSSPQAPLPNPWGGSSPSSTGSPPPNMASLFGGMVPPPQSGAGGMPGGMFPGMGGMGGMPSPAQQAASRQMLQNPAMRQMMSQMLSDPNTIQQLSSSNPELGRMLENPMMRNMLSDPNFLESMANMPALGGMGGMPGGMGGMPGGMNPLMQGFPPPMFPPPQQQSNASPNGTIPAFDFSSVLSGLNAATVAPAPTNTSSSNTTPVSSTPIPQPLPPPSERFAAQNAQLQSMGFTDSTANINALTQTNGNINAAVERLLGSS